MKKIAQNAGRHFLLVLLSLFAIFPLYWMIISSLKGQGEIFAAAGKLSAGQLYLRISGNAHCAYALQFHNQQYRSDDAAAS